MCELIWIYQLLVEFWFEITMPINYCTDNQATLHISSNLVFYDRSKYIEFDCPFVREETQHGLLYLQDI